MAAVTDLEERLHDALVSHGTGLAAAYLFGSIARGDDRPGSDVDVAVLFEDDPPPRLEGLPVDLHDALQTAAGRRLDLVVLNGAPPDLGHRILRDGRLILDRNPSRRIAFEVRTRNAYFDLLPVLRRYRQQPSKAPTGPR